MARWFLLFSVLFVDSLGILTDPCKCCNQCKSRFNSPVANDRGLRCYCEHEDCWENNDCCEDATRKRDLVRNTKRSCELIDSYRKKSYFVVNSCPKDWSDDNVRFLCAKDVEMYHYALDLPFQSNYTRMLYSNVYCAVCNGDFSPTNALEINFTCGINCRMEVIDIDRLIYEPGNLTWIDPVSKKKFQIGIKGDGFRECDGKVVEKCAEGWKDEKISFKCSSYANYVTIRGRSYRNVYCAICNYENVSDVNCGETGPQNCHQTPENRFCYQKSTTTSSVSEQKIFGISFPPLINHDEKCPPNSVSYDSGSCVPFLCGKNYKPENGNCVPVNVSHNETQMSCPAILISIDELTIFENKSIYRNNTNTFYHTNEYELINETFYLVCISLSSPNTLEPSEILSMICISTSLISLSCHITIQYLIGNYKNIADKNILNMSFSLFLVYFVSLITNFVNISKSVCYVFSAITLYCFLVYFFTVNAMAYDICKTITKSELKTNSNKTFVYYVIYSWITPLIIIILAVTVDENNVLPNLKPYYGTISCFIDSTTIMLMFFFLPFAILLIKNVIFFSLTAHAIRKTAKLTKQMRKSYESKQFSLYVKLAFVMGGMWVLSLINLFLEISILNYISVIINDSQGTIVFLVFTVKKSVWKKLRNSKKRVIKETLSTEAFALEKTTNS